MHGVRLVMIAAAMAPIGASAQSVVPAPPYYAMTPGVAAAPNGQSPVQQQILEGYRTQLLQSQRDMQLQNPAGLGREQLEVTRQLNTMATMPAPSYNPAMPAPAGRAPRYFMPPSAAPSYAMPPAAGGAGPAR